MRRWLLGVALVGALTGAKAQPVPDGVLLPIVGEAMGLMENCRDGSAGAACRRGRDQFMVSYTRARLGQVPEMREVMKTLVQGRLPVRQNTVAACTWAMMVAGGTQDRQPLDQYCAALSQPQRSEAAREMGGLLVRMQADMRAMQGAGAR